MSASHERGRRRYGVYAVGIALLVFGGVTFFFGYRNFAIRSGAVLACMIGVYLIARSNNRGEARGWSREGPEISGGGRRGPSATRWFVGVLLVATVLIAFAFLYRDAMSGYKEVGPVYLFAGAIVVCAVFWGYLIARLYPSRN
jgi:hypothetical protein